MMLVIKITDAIKPKVIIYPTSSKLRKIEKHLFITHLNTPWQYIGCHTLSNIDKRISIANRYIDIYYQKNYIIFQSMHVLFKIYKTEVNMINQAIFVLVRDICLQTDDTFVNNLRIEPSIQLRIIIEQMIDLDNRKTVLDYYTRKVWKVHYD